jgi:galactose mutarotase-like enzyme
MAVAELEHRVWGEWPSIRLATPAASIEVVAEVGARIVSLRDEQRHREWLLTGAPPGELELMAWATEDVVFAGRASFGWDECLPTTAPSADPLAPDGPPLRDHGDQWGRGAYLSLDHAAGTVTHAWSAPRWAYRLARRLSFEDERSLLVEYSLRSLATERLPVSWAAHPVLALESGGRLDLPGVDTVRCSWRHGLALPDELAWPLATLEARALDLSTVRPGEGWAAVLYAAAPGPVSAVALDGSRLTFDWDRAFAPSLRVWQSHGGWPPDGERRQQIALEPCTSEHDDLAGAIEAGAARALEPGDELAWWVRVIFDGAGP